MKSFAALAVIGLVSAQSLSDLPQCGQTCVTNMVGIAATTFGCKLGDVTCYCSQQNFGYGLRDCAQEACGPEVAAQVISYGTQYCQQALASAGTSAQAALSTGAVGILSSAIASGSGAAASMTGSAASLTGSAASAASSAASSVASDASSALSSVEASASSALSSAMSGASSMATSVLSSAASGASSLAGAASSAAGSGASKASSAAASATGGSSGAAVPMMTAFPMAGAVGMAAMLLI